MLPHRDTVVSIVSLVRGIFKTWEGGLGGKERAKRECFRPMFGGVGSPTQEWHRVLATLVKDIWAGPEHGYGRGHLGRNLVKSEGYIHIPVEFLRGLCELHDWGTSSMCHAPLSAVSLLHGRGIG